MPPFDDFTNVTIGELTLGTVSVPDGTFTVIHNTTKLEVESTAVKVSGNFKTNNIIIFDDGTIGIRLSGTDLFYVGLPGQVLVSNGSGSAVSWENQTDTTYTAGTGLSLVGTEFTNTAPDQTVILTGSGATTITGTYPNFTISSTDTNTTYTAGTGLSLVGTTFNNTAPDLTVSLTGSGATTVSGIYPSFTISSTDTTFSAGTGLSLVGTTFNNTAPDQIVSLTGTGATTVTGTYPNFTIYSTNTDKND